MNKKVRAGGAPAAGSYFPRTENVANTGGLIQTGGNVAEGGKSAPRLKPGPRQGKA